MEFLQQQRLDGSGEAPGGAGSGFRGWDPFPKHPQNPGLGFFWGEDSPGPVIPQ